MMFLELHIITICAILCAIEPARKLWRSAANWVDRQRIHRAHMKQLEQEHG